jgi:hypothetical protein
VRLERDSNAPRADQAGHGRHIRNALVIDGNGSETSAAYALGDSGDAFLARWTLHTRVVAGCSLTAVVRLTADLAKEEGVREQALAAEVQIGGMFCVY